jgi:hypothetical protein
MTHNLPSLSIPLYYRTHDTKYTSFITRTHTYIHTYIRTRLYIHNPQILYLIPFIIFSYKCNTLCSLHAYIHTQYTQQRSKVRRFFATSLASFLAGAAAGLVCDFFMWPVETIKTRLQVICAYVQNQLQSCKYVSCVFCLC